MDWISFILGASFVIVVESIIIITIVVKSFNSYMKTGAVEKYESTDNQNSSNE